MKQMGPFSALVLVAISAPAAAQRQLPSPTISRAAPQAQPDNTLEVDAAVAGPTVRTKSANRWTGNQTFESITTFDMGGSSVPAAWLKTNLRGAWPGLIIENTARDLAAQTQVFWKRWDATGKPLVWQIALDTDNNSGWKGLFNIEAIDINGAGVIATPISMARTGEVGIGTGVPRRGQQLTVGGDTRIQRGAGSAVDGALILGANGNVQIYGNSTAGVLAFSAQGSEAARIVGSNLLVGKTNDTGERLQVAGTARVGSLKLARVTVARLPACNDAAEGELFAVVDASSAVFNAPIMSGGSNHVMAYCNGVDWTVH